MKSFRLKRIPILTLLIVMLSIVLLFFSSLAKKDEKRPNQDDIKLLNRKLKDYNIPVEKRKVLISKFINGEMWDSQKPEFQYLKPQIVKDNYTKTIYPDGSIKIEGIIEDLSDFKQIYSSGLSMREKSYLELNERLRNAGVSDLDRKNLMDKFRNGEPWDSMKPEYQNLKPQIDTPHHKKIIYPDGSISETIINSDFSNNNLIKPSRAGYKRASAYKELLFVALYFEVRYRQSAQTNEAQILEAENFSNRAIGATIHEIPASEGGRGHLYGWRNPTCAWHSVNAVAYDNAGSKKYWLKYYVNGTQSWQRSN